MRADIFPLLVRKVIDWHFNHVWNLYFLGICSHISKRFGVSVPAICVVSLKCAITSTAPQDRLHWTASQNHTLISNRFTKVCVHMGSDHQFRIISISTCIKWIMLHLKQVSDMRSAACPVLLAELNQKEFWFNWTLPTPSSQTCPKDPEWPHSLTWVARAVLQAPASGLILPSWKNESPCTITCYSPDKGWKPSQVHYGSLAGRQWFYRMGLCVWAWQKNQR